LDEQSGPTGLIWYLDTAGISDTHKIAVLFPIPVERSATPSDHHIAGSGADDEHSSMCAELAIPQWLAAEP
jgi:hypothetical protein